MLWLPVVIPGPPISGLPEIGSRCPSRVTPTWVRSEGARNPYSLSVVIDSGLAPSARPGMTARVGAPRYLKVIKSVRLSVEALFFNGSFVAFALF